jgi:predicted ribosome quality control (RQC) complex YloA/Tae2 family protein
MERELSSFDIYVIVRELQELVGGYIDKLHQPSKTELIIRVKKRETKQIEQLFIQNEKFICLTEKRVEALKKPTTFAMTLRKYLLNGRITKITQHEFDRILHLTVSKKEGEYILVFEFFTNGNIILVGPQNNIILPLKVQRWSHRTIKPHELYRPPPSQKNPFHLSFEEFNHLLQESARDLVRTLAVNLNLSGLYAEELCIRAAIDKHMKPGDMDAATRNKLYNTLTEFLTLFKDNKLQPVYVKQKDNLVDILPLPFQSYKERELIKTTSFTRGLQEFVEVARIKPVEKRGYQKQVGKLERQFQQQKKAVEEFKQKIQQKKQEGDLIYLNFHRCQEVLDEISTVLELKDKDDGIAKINQNALVKTFDPVSNKLIVILSDDVGRHIEVSLDFRKSVAENAEKAYRASKKLGEKLKGAQEAIKVTQQQIKDLKKKKIVEKLHKGKTQSLKRFWFDRFHWFISSEGNLVIGGRDAKTNELVVKKYLRAGDRYVHADVHGAPSCIVKNVDIHGEVIPISEKTLAEACVFAGCYSKAWKQFGEVQVYWVLPEQVSKTPQSGEFLGTGAFVIRGKRNYRSVTLEIAVGEITLDENTLIMGGPREAMQKQSRRYVLIQPGGIAKNAAAKQLAKVFDVSVDEIMRVLPPGDLQVVETVGCQL